MIDTSPDSLPANDQDIPTRAHRSSWGIVIDGCLLVLLAAVLVFHAKAEETGFISARARAGLGVGVDLGRDPGHHKSGDCWDTDKTVIVGPPQKY